MDEIVKLAIDELDINVPIYRTEIRSGKVTLWLYGRAEPVTWPEKWTGDDFRTIRGVGDQSQSALLTAGISTFDQLRATSHEKLVAIGLTKRTVAAIERWQEKGE